MKAFKTLLFLFVSINLCAQTTNFDGRNKIQSNGYTGALYQVKIDRNRNLTFVKIELVLTRNKNWLKSGTSFFTTIKSGEYIAKYIGSLENGTISKIDCDDNWGWSKVKKGEKYYDTLVFDGAIPPGLTDFSLIDIGSLSGCRGFSFRNYTLNNPDNHPNTSLSETSLKQKIDELHDEIVGIYEPFDKSGYKLGCIKDGQTYKLVYLSSGTHRSWWKMGDLKAILRPSSTLGIFKADWYMANKTINSNVYVTFNGTSMKTIIDGDENGYLKMYPTNSGSRNLSGTGFAISSNGIIVTNYHVIDGAKSIKVRGVHSDFNKTYTAKVIVSDKNNDLALIQIDSNNFTSLGTIPYTIKTNIAGVGENIFVLGYPLRATMGDEIKLTNGIISSRTGFQGEITSYQISAPVQPGNSGGPLFDSQGNILGIINSKHNGAENVSYAVKASYLTSLIDLLANTTKLPTVNLLAGKTLTQQAELVKKFVYIIETD